MPPRRPSRRGGGCSRSWIRERIASRSRHAAAAAAGPWSNFRFPRFARLGVKENSSSNCFRISLVTVMYISSKLHSEYERRRPKSGPLRGRLRRRPHDDARACFLRRVSLDTRARSPGDDGPLQSKGRADSPQGQDGPWLRCFLRSSKMHAVFGRPRDRPAGNQGPGLGPGTGLGPPLKGRRPPPRPPQKPRGRRPEWT